MGPAARKYEMRQADILRVAIANLNRYGLRGLNLSEVAAAVGMSKANLTYYYRRREDLAEACFARTLVDYTAMVDTARAAGPDVGARIGRLVGAYFDRMAEIAERSAMPLAILAEIRSLEEPHSTRMISQFSSLLVSVADLLGRGPAQPDAILRTAPLAEIILIELFWAEAWLNQYPPRSYPRVAERFSDILWNGLASSRTGWRDDWSEDARRTGTGLSQDPVLGEFFRAAIRTINQYGYRGASLDRIAGELDATKGAIYNRFETKDDLVAACFSHSVSSMWMIIEACEQVSGSAWEKLFRTVAAFAAFQTSESGPFLRETALTFLPGPHRLETFRKIRQVQVHLASLIADAIAEGKARPVDPLLASQMILAATNGVDEINRFTPDGIVFDPVSVCTRPVLLGMQSVLDQG